MFKSKKTYLIYSIALLALALFLLVNIIISWNNMMHTNPERLFFRIIFFAFFAYKAIDIFFEWRNHGKPKIEQE